jgi:hypothetical protein
LNNWFQKVEIFLKDTKNFLKILATSENSYGICFRFFEQQNSMADSKKRVIKSLDTLSEDLIELLKRQYPNGYEGNITRIATPKKEPMFVFPLETEDAIYLVKVPVTKNSDGGYDIDDKGGEEEFSTNSDSEDYGNDDGYSGSGSGDNDDYDEDGGGSSRGSGTREASYDPDFDS